MLLRFGFWLSFFVLLVLRLEVFLTLNPPKPILRNSETFFSGYQEIKKVEFKEVSKQWVHYPYLHALQEAVWKGDLNFFPAEVREFYFYSGTLPVLALSGQHVSVLVFILRSLLNLFSKVLNALKWDLYIRMRSYFWSGTREALFVLGAAILFLSSQGNASALRTLALYLGVLALSLWFKFTSKVQCLTTSAAILVFLHPPWIFQVGFILSFVGVFLLFLLEGKSKKLLFLFPVLMAPFTAYFFGKVFLASFVIGVPLAVIWNAIWIPLGFLLPLFFNPLGRGFLPWFEKSFHAFCEIHLWSVGLVRSSMISVGVPSLVEVIVIEFWILGAALFFMSSRISPSSTP